MQHFNVLPVDDPAEELWYGQGSNDEGADGKAAVGADTAGHRSNRTGTDQSSANPIPNRRTPGVYTPDGRVAFDEYTGEWRQRRHEELKDIGN